MSKKKKAPEPPPLLKRPRKPKSGKAGKLIKKLHQGLWETGTAFVNPPSVVTDRLVGSDSPINANKLGGRVVDRLGLGALVPDKYKPKKKPKYGAGKIGPPEKPKTWRDRMNARKPPK